MLHVDDDTGETDLVIDPLNNKTLYAATYQRRRAQWGMNGGGAGSGIWKSTDARPDLGEDRNRIAGRPEGPIGLDDLSRNPERALRDRRASRRERRLSNRRRRRAWRKLSDTNPRPMYFSQIRVDPQTDSRIYVLGVRCTSPTTAGGPSAATAPNAFTSITMRCGSTRATRGTSSSATTAASAFRTIGRETWAWMPNLLGAQAYHVEFDMQTPYHVCAGLQDNNTWCGPSAVRTNSGIINDDWYVISGGDGFQPLMDPTDAASSMRSHRTAA